MKLASVLLIIIALLVGIVIPQFLHGRLSAINFTLPTSGGETHYEIPKTAVIVGLRGIGVFLALGAVICFVFSRRKSDTNSN